MGKLIKFDFSPKGKELYHMTKEHRDIYKNPLSTIQKIEEIFKKQAHTKR